MAAKVWEDIKKGVEDSITFATEKTKELTAISKLKLAITGIKRNIDAKLKELGKHVYNKLEAGEARGLAKDGRANELVKQIKDLETELSAKEQELEGVGKEKEEASEEETVEPASESK